MKSSIEIQSSSNSDWRARPSLPSIKIQSSNIASSSNSMIDFFWPTSRKGLSTFRTHCPVGVQIAQMVVCFAHFQVRARPPGWQRVTRLRWGFCRRTYPRKLKWAGGGILGKMRPHLAQMRDPIWHFKRKVGNSALELGRTIQSFEFSPSNISSWKIKFAPDSRFGIIILFCPSGPLGRLLRLVGSGPRYTICVTLFARCRRAGRILWTA